MTTILIRTLTAATLLCAATTVAAQTIGLVQINEEAQFFQEMNRGAREAAGAHGAELMVFDADNLMWKQDNAIKTAIREDMDALLVVAIDVHRIMPAVTRATEAGIVVVGVDAVLPEGPQVAQVGTLSGDDVATVAVPFAAGLKAQLGVEAEGFVKLAYGVENGRLCGGAAIGDHAADVLAPVAVALQAKMTIVEFGRLYGAHPTVSELAFIAARQI